MGTLLPTRYPPVSTACVTGDLHTDNDGLGRQPLFHREKGIRREENADMPSSAVIQICKRVLRETAEKTACDKTSPKWKSSKEWPLYSSGNAARQLYKSFSDQELIEILCETAESVARMPTKTDVFCVYRLYIQRRFGNWPNALIAAGLKKRRKQ